MSSHISVIYSYTTPLRDADNRKKIGSAWRIPKEKFANRLGGNYSEWSRDAELVAWERISQQQAGAGDERGKEILIGVWDVTDIAPTMSDVQRLEKGILHKDLKRQGRWVNPGAIGSEWFWVGKDEFASMVNSLPGRFGSHRPHSYKMRVEQDECYNKAVGYFNSGGDRFLVNAKPRFGKTFTSYHIAKALDVKRVLIMSYKTQVDVGWKEDLFNHVDFEGFHFVHKEDFSRKNPVDIPGGIDEDDVVVFWTSYQDINAIGKDKWSILRNMHFDLIIIDEYHFGAGTDRARRTLDSISHDRELCLSGTPIKALVTGEFSDEARYDWTYNDEQKMKGSGSLVHQDMPTMYSHIMNVGDEVHKLMNNYDEEEGFNFAKFLASDDGKFPNDLSAVNKFLDRVAGVGVHKNLSPYSMKGIRIDLNHSIWYVPPYQNTINAIANVIRNHPAFKDFMVFSANGASDDIRDKVINDVRRNIRIAKKEGKKTITIAGTMLNTGVTFPEWNMVMMLNDTKSPESYFQSIFRCQNPNKDKMECHVFDYSPQRALVMAYNYAELMSPLDKTTEEYLSDWIDFAPILDHQTNKMREIEIGDIYEAIIASNDYSVQFTNERLFNKSKFDENLRISLLGIDKFDNNGNRKESINDNGIDPGKNKNGRGRNKGNENRSKDEVKELIEKLKNITRHIPTFLFMIDNQISSIEEIKNGSDKIKNYFEEFTGIDIDQFWHFCISGVINMSQLNRRILSINMIERKI